MNHSPSTNNIATAPEVPSSTRNTNMSYYDPRSAANSNYYPSASASVQQQPLYALQGQPGMDSVAAAAVAAAAAARIPNNALPPLSQLLTSSDNTSNNNTTKPTRSSSIVESQVSTTEPTGDYFSPQQTALTANATTAHTVSPQNNASTIPTQYAPQSTATLSPQQQQQMNNTYRKGVDYQGNLYQTSHSDMAARRRTYVPSTSENYYMLPPQQHHPQYNTSTSVAPNISVFPPPHPSYNGSRNYHLPSPPTSVIDGNPRFTYDGQYHGQHPMMYNSDINSPDHNSQKVFSFVPLPGLNQKKRPRRKFHEVERLYQCNYQDCTKSYGTLNHLNAHVSMQRHGPKRQPTEFKELRKMWRKQKRDHKQRSDSRSSTHSLEDDSQVSNTDEDNNTVNNDYHGGNAILSHSHTPVLASNLTSYNNMSAPYNHHQTAMHPSLMTHTANNNWMNTQRQYNNAEFMPQSY